MRKPINEMRLVIPSRSANESFARSAVAAFIAQLDPAVDELADIRTAVSEAVTNCIVHAYPDDIGDIILTVRLFADGKVTIRIKDKGCGIENVPQAMEPLFTTGGEEQMCIRDRLYGKGQGPHPGCQAGQVYQGHRDHLFRSGFHWYADYQVHLNATDG